MELQFYKKGENTESGDEITTYYALGEKRSTLIMMNRQPPQRFIVSCLPAGIEIKEGMKEISVAEFLAAATVSNDALDWYLKPLGLK